MKNTTTGDRVKRKARPRRETGEVEGGSPIEVLALSLTKTRDEWVLARAQSGVERRWLDDLAHYDGRDINQSDNSLIERVTSGGMTARRSPSRNANAEARSRVFQNITRPKTNSANARIGNMLFPVDERNFGIGPTPVPELADQVGDTETVLTQGGEPIPTGDGTPLTAADEAKRILDEAGKRAKAMEDEIADQLSECQYNAQGRMVIRDAAMVGTGVMKGPIVRGVVERSWGKLQAPDGSSVYQLTWKESQKPFSVRVSCWDVFPDPNCGANPHDGQGIWERSRLTKRKLRDLARVEGYDGKAIMACLREEPKGTNLYDAYDAELLIRHGIYNPRDSRYECWTYTGDLSRKDLEAAGIEVPEDADLMNLSAVVAIVNGRVIKAHLNPLDTGDIPYDFFVYEECEGSPWGYGVPYLMRTGQRIVNAGWRQMMDNAGTAVGPQIVINRDGIEPANGSYDIRGLKLWYASGETRDVREAMAVFSSNSHIRELMEIVKFAMQFVDEETGLPTLLQGGERQEWTGSPETLGGLTMRMNAASEFLRSVAKRFDDRLTTPHIRRYYDYNMQYSPKDEIKGDLQVEARGTSALVVRDIQNQAIIQLVALAGNPVWAMGIKKWQLLRKVFEANHFSASEFVEEDGVIKAREEQQPQADPAIELEKLKGELKMRAEELNAQVKREQLQAEKEIAILNYAREVKLGEAKLKALLADTTIKERNKKELFAAEARLKLSPANPTNQGI